MGEILLLWGFIVFIIFYEGNRLYQNSEFKELIIFLDFFISSAIYGSLIIAEADLVNPLDFIPQIMKNYFDISVILSIRGIPLY